MAQGAGVASTDFQPELEAQEEWYLKIGKLVGAKRTGSQSIFQTNSERLKGRGTAIHRLFPDITFETKTWRTTEPGFGQIPLMSRTVGYAGGRKARTGLVFLAGLYSANEAARTWQDLGNEMTDVIRGQDLKQYMKIYQKLELLANPNKVRPFGENEDLTIDYNRPGYTVSGKLIDAGHTEAGELQRLREKRHGTELDTDEEGQSRLSDPLFSQEMTKDRANLLHALKELTPDGLFETTQTEHMNTYANNWIIMVAGKDTNIHLDKYKRDGFVEFLPIAETLIKYLRREAKQGHDQFTELLRYFDKIAEHGTQGFITNDKWYIKAPNNNKMQWILQPEDDDDPSLGVRETTDEDYAQLQNHPAYRRYFDTMKRKAFFDGIIINEGQAWENIIKLDMAPLAPPEPDDEDDDDEPEKAKFERFTPEGRVRPFVRTTGETLRIDGKDVQEGTWAATPLGRRAAATLNYEDACCQQLKERLVAILNEALKSENSDIHPSKVEQKIFGMSCTDLSEYMEPPEVSPNNFNNLEFYGISIGDVEQNVFLEATGLAGDIHQGLFDEYEKCLEYKHSEQVIKPPSELTDPKQSTHWSGPKGEEQLEGEFQEGREFEGFSWDTGIETGTITDDEKKPHELQREAIIEGRRVEFNDPTYQEEFRAQPMQERQWQAQLQAMKKPTETEFKRIQKVIMDEIGSDMSKFQAAWGNKSLMTEAGVSENKWLYTYENYDDLYEEYVRKGGT